MEDLELAENNFNSKTVRLRYCLGLCQKRPAFEIDQLILNYINKIYILKLSKTVSSQRKFENFNKTFR